MFEVRDLEICLPRACAQRVGIDLCTATVPLFEGSSRFCMHWSLTQCLAANTDIIGFVVGFSPLSHFTPGFADHVGLFIF